jgi:hypothetical protein
MTRDQSRGMTGLPALLVGGLFAAFFFYRTGFGLFTPLGYDDVMNATFAWLPPLHKLLQALLNPFTSFYRPAGSAVYRLLFGIFGLNPLPFRIAVYSMLLLNLLLVYRLVLRLGGAREIAAMATLLYTYHGRMSAIYLNNGTIYDVLCGTFTLLTTLYYVAVREKRRRLGKREWLIFLALFTLALNSKEMAGAIPLLLIVYELSYHWPYAKGSRSSPGALVVQALPALICGVMTLGAAIARMSSASVMHANPAYAMSVSLHQFLDHWNRLMADLVYARTPEMTLGGVIAIWAALTAVAAIVRKPYVTFFTAWALLAPLPVVFFPFRGFFVMYVPLVGWAVVAAAVLVEGRDWIWRRVYRRAPLSMNPFEPERILLFVLTASTLVSITRHDVLSERRTQDPGQLVIAEMKSDILKLHEPVPKGAQLLFLHDRFPAQSWGAVMISRLLYNDRDLWADRPTMMDRPPDEASYDRVFDYSNGSLVVVRRRAANPATPRILNYPE